MKTPRKTLNEKIEFEGVGLHSGKDSKINLVPQTEGGIRFKSLETNEEFSLNDNNSLSSNLSSDIGTETFKIRTVEHFFACLHVFGITDLLIEISGPEIPILDGSALPFANKFNLIGTKKLNEEVEILEPEEEIKILDENKSVSIKKGDHFEVEYNINFNHPSIGKQTFKSKISMESFLTEIAPARTFGFFKDFEALKSMGLALGANLENVLVLDEKGVLNKDGLRFENEFVRHKVLDFLGDSYLFGIPIKGVVNASYAGHAMHQKLLKELFSSSNS